MDRHAVSILHFGVRLEMNLWKSLPGRLTKAGIEFVIEAHIRFEGLPGEQSRLVRIV